MSKLSAPTKLKAGIAIFAIVVIVFAGFMYYLRADQNNEDCTTYYDKTGRAVLFKDCK